MVNHLSRVRLWIWQLQQGTVTHLNITVFSGQIWLLKPRSLWSLQGRAARVPVKQQVRIPKAFVNSKTQPARPVQQQMQTARTCKIKGEASKCKFRGTAGKSPVKTKTQPQKACENPTGTETLTFYNSKAECVSPWIDDFQKGSETLSWLDDSEYSQERAASAQFGHINFETSKESSKGKTHSLKCGEPQVAVGPGELQVTLYQKETQPQLKVKEPAITVGRGEAPSPAVYVQ